MKQKINLETWNRKEHFLFFKQMEEPFFGITTSIDCTIAYQKAKELGVSFFTYYLHKTLIAVNAFSAASLLLPYTLCGLVESDSK